MLFQGVKPARILCLTYTKAAANEMQVRLFETLGAWAMADDPTLRSALIELGEEQPLTDADLRRARQMFATAIETPGGLKIQTIHAFCASVLRRFPLEAGITPRFREMDSRDTDGLIDKILDEIAETDGEIFFELAAQGPQDTKGLSKAILTHRARFQSQTSDQIFAHFGLPADFDSLALLDEYAFSEADGRAIESFANAPFEEGTNDFKAAAKLKGQKAALECIPALESVFLYGKGAKSPFGASQPFVW